MSPGNRRVLIVDDDPDMRRLLGKLLGDAYTLEYAVSGLGGLQKAGDFRPDLVLLDIMMPGIDGYETCRRMKSDARFCDTQIVMVSSKSRAAEQRQAFEVGADDYVVKPFDAQELRCRVALHVRLREAVATVRGVRLEIQSHNAEIKRLAEERTQEILATQDVAVFTMAKVAESRDQETGDHLLRIRSYSQILARQMARDPNYAAPIDARFLDDLFRSSPLHDIGKVGIADAILLKPSQLTVEEFELMKRHTIIGANILDQAVQQSRNGGFLAMASIIARFHHERFDGTGYPAGLVGDEIPLPARIVALADVFDALTSRRPYKRAVYAERTKEMILAESGRHFDPDVVSAFERGFAEFQAVMKKYSDAMPLVTGAMAFAEYGELTRA